ncbi:uncharacterized protein LOC134926333 [Pseudophryne corroboree]|uniref:uncharacterized protein LOC134926333 n=1 Tax=Pseudophryne corroboree TaxID=495146 RepID=UPI0030814AB5
MPPKKKPSGAEYRKRKRAREEEARRLSNNDKNWLTTPGNDAESSNVEPPLPKISNIKEEPHDTIETDNEGISNTKQEIKKEPHDTIETDNEGISNTKQEIKEEPHDTTETDNEGISNTKQEIKEDPHDTSETEDEGSDLENDTDSTTIRVDNKMLGLKFEDPQTWPNITDKVRCYLVKHGPEQQKDANFALSANSNGRRFSRDWFFKTLPNGETMERSWLIYSTARRAIFCFPCMLFGKKSPLTPNIANPQRGFSNWRHLNPRLVDHEKSSDHFQNFLSWRLLERQLTKGSRICQEFEPEKEKWNTIFKILLDAILFCAQNNHAVPGSCDIMEEPNSEIVYGVMKLISHYNFELAEHIAKCEKDGVSYFPPAVLNEFVNLLGNTVRKELINRVKEAKYYSIIFDSFPDTTHEYQLCEIIRYVRFSDGQCSVEESFLDFIGMDEKTSSDFATEIGLKLSKDGLDPGNMRGQCYDNSPHMAGKYSKVQARLKKMNNLATTVPGSARSLSQEVVHIASSPLEMIMFFGAVQRLFNLFAVSTSRWETLNRILKITLQAQSDTRWSSEASAVRSLSDQLPGVLDELYEIYENSGSCPEAVSWADELIDQINFKYVCFLIMWRQILSSVDTVSQALQQKGVSVDQAAKLIGRLVNVLQQMREEGVDPIMKEAANLAQSMDLPVEFPVKRKITIHKNEAKDEDFDTTNEQDFRRRFINLIDALIARFKWRCEILTEISSDFEFLTGPALSSMPLNALKKCASDLAIKYCNDLSASEIVAEIESFKSCVPSIIPDCSTATAQDILQQIHKRDLVSVYPSIYIALRIFLSIPVTVPSCEENISIFNSVEEYLRSMSGQECYSNMAILSIEHKLTSSINFDSVIEEFASVMARKAIL